MVQPNRAMDLLIKAALIIVDALATLWGRKAFPFCRLASEDVISQHYLYDRICRLLLLEVRLDRGVKCLDDFNPSIFFTLVSNSSSLHFERWEVRIE